MIWLAGCNSYVCTLHAYIWKIEYAYDDRYDRWDRPVQYFPSRCIHSRPDDMAYEHIELNKWNSFGFDSTAHAHEYICVWCSNAESLPRWPSTISFSLILSVSVCVCVLFYRLYTIRFALWNTSYASVKYEYSMQRKIINLFSIFQ